MESLVSGCASPALVGNRRNCAGEPGICAITHFWSGDNARAVKVAEGLRTGTVWINDWHMINPRYPFGGYKQSGLGREHGEIGFDEYREIKHIHVDLAGQERGRHPWWDISVPKHRGPDVPGPEFPGSKPAG